MTKISVIIPTYNRADMLKRTIKSVLDQSYNNYELIIVDDGSTDNTQEVVTSFSKKHSIVYVQQKENRGVSVARNIGLSLATGKYTCFLDSDDIWEKDKLKKQVHFMEAHPDKLVTQVEEVWIRNGKQVNPKNKHRKPSGDIFIPSLKLCLVSPSAVMLHRKVLDEVGYFDEKMPVCEDYDLWLRIALKYQVYLIEEKLINKIGGHPDQLSRKYWGMDRFRVYAMEKHLHKDISFEKFKELMSELKFKSRVLYQGALKRKNMMIFAKYFFKYLYFSFVYFKRKKFSNKNKY